MSSISRSNESISQDPSLRRSSSAQDLYSLGSPPAKGNSTNGRSFVRNNPLRNSSKEEPPEKNPLEQNRLTRHASMMLPKGIFDTLSRKNSSITPESSPLCLKKIEKSPSKVTAHKSSDKASFETPFEVDAELKGLYELCDNLHRELDCFVENRAVLERFEHHLTKGVTLDGEKLKKARYVKIINEWLEYRNLYELLKLLIPIEESIEKDIYGLDLDRGRKIEQAINDREFTEACVAESFEKIGYEENRITRISNRFFTNFSRSGLITINLSDNRIQSINGSFDEITASDGKNPSLERLELQNNLVIKDFPQGLCKCKKLTYLDLSNNSIETIPLMLYELNELKTLLLSHNKISACTIIKMGNLKNLVKLDLSHNALVSIPDDMGDVKNLEDLNLSHNFLESLPSSMGNLKNLHTLHVNDNKIKEIADVELRGLMALKHFDGSNNQFENLPSFAFHCPHIEDIYLAAACSDSKKKRIFELSPPETVNLPNLLTVILQRNGLKEINVNLDKWHKLSTLDVSHNDLDSLPNSLTYCMNLKILDISGNIKLKRIPNPPTNLEFLKSEGTPLKKSKQKAHKTAKIEKKGKSEFLIPDEDDPIAPPNTPDSVISSNICLIDDF